MNASAPIDAIAVARAIIADPRKKFTMSVLQIMAICEALVGVEDHPQPAISNELAAAAANFFAADASLAAATEPNGWAEGHFFDDRDDALKAFKTLFETEFPNV